MRRIAWLTDIHLDCAPPRLRDALADDVTRLEPDYVLVSGDIGTAPSLEQYLSDLSWRVRRPIFFVLGNHDFYYGTFRQVHSVTERLSISSQGLVWLTAYGVMELSKDTALVGHDSWADGRSGSGARSQVELNDYHLIGDFTGISPRERFRRMNALGDEAARWLRMSLQIALRRYRHILLLTHVPPFPEVCRYRGAPMDEEWLPHFSCQTVGAMLVEMMRTYPSCDLTVLCGHTHNVSQADILPNLHVNVGGARYGHPQVQALLIS